MFGKLLIAVVFVALVFSSLSLAQIDKVAIFNESVGWTTVDVAAAATDIILANVTKANDVAVYDDAGMGDFVAANTDDGNVDIIVLFGYVPPSTYAPGNAEPDGSPEGPRRYPGGWLGRCHGPDTGTRTQTWATR